VGKIHNEELHIIRAFRSRRIRWAEHVSRIGKIRNVYKISAGKPEEKRQLGRLRCRWDVNEMRCDDVSWIHPAQERVQWRAPVHTVRNNGVLFKQAGNLFSY
jgi:hypothetical protein